MKVFLHKSCIIVCCRPQGRETRDTSEFKMGPRDVLACAWQVLLVEHILLQRTFYFDVFLIVSTGGTWDGVPFKYEGDIFG